MKAFLLVAGRTGLAGISGESDCRGKCHSGNQRRCELAAGELDMLLHTCVDTLYSNR
jgi:hypothetical protein